VTNAPPVRCLQREWHESRRENITDRALEEFRTHYKDKSIPKRDVFHYAYALLHHPLYRERYAANLKRELPRIPFAPDFQAFADIGKRLAEIHHVHPPPNDGFSRCALYPSYAG
jgi:predicted helicase